MTLVDDGEAGARAIAEGGFDLALVDIELPGKGGLEVIAEVRGDPNPKRAALPLLAFTAYALPHHRARIDAAGADGIIVESHCDPAEAMSDGPQQLRADQFQGFMDAVTAMARNMGKHIGREKARAA